MVELGKAPGLLLHRRGRVASSFLLMNYVLYKLLQQAWRGRKMAAQMPNSRSLSTASSATASCSLAPMSSVPALPSRTILPVPLPGCSGVSSRDSPALLPQPYQKPSHTPPQTPPRLPWRLCRRLSGRFARTLRSPNPLLLF